ncbi:TetR/AcrR family transcriptional regulator [Paenibacillus humicola]|uniref:TetR/AcrR family transcriptional regulator n=1 Tax=Paenibacillus humicola TaxID=3110540 RepID=UPI00237A4445|nr:TetR/AcrR family transcriptional regulator [Paenibacillus humicola]
MTTRRKKLTEDIKANIRSAAAGLFADKGYPSVTMREIAKAAGCSHTAIYLYYKSKEDLLQQIAIPPLEQLERRMREQLDRPDPAEAPLMRLTAICREYVEFCLTNAGMYKVLFTSGSVRVDEPEPALEVNRLRNRLFAHIMHSLRLTIDETGSLPDEHALQAARMLFYYVQGFVSTYSDHAEPLGELLVRTLPIMEEGIGVIVAGLKARAAADWRKS